METKFNLQLFAEDVAGSDTGEALESAASNTDIADNATEPAPANAGEPAETAKPPVAITKDDMGRRRVVFPQEMEAAAPPAAAQIEPAEATAETDSAVKPYTAGELFQEIALGHKVDESRIPQELANDYSAIRQQQLNAVNQQAQVTQQVQEVPTMHQPEQQGPSKEELQQQARQAQLEALREIQKMAENKAKADLGITDEDIEDAAYSDDDDVQLKMQAYKQAVQMNMNIINQQIMANRAKQQAIEAQRQQETQEAMAVIGPKWEEYKKDPHYNEIDDMMEHYYEKMPYSEGIKVKASIDRLLSGRPVKADYDILNNYYLKTKEAYYAKQTGVGTVPQPVHKSAPPYVEATGQTSAAPHKTVDWSKMRNMTPAQRSQFFRANFH